MSLYTLAQNGVRYYQPVHDPFFAADNQSLSIIAFDGTRQWFKNYMVTGMACVEQFKICNPASENCTPWTGVISVWDESKLKLDLNPTQIATLNRLQAALVLSMTWLNVFGLNGGGTMNRIFHNSIANRPCSTTCQRLSLRNLVSRLTVESMATRDNPLVRNLPRKTAVLRRRLRLQHEDLRSCDHA